jgi:hypothetical protein
MNTKREINRGNHSLTDRYPARGGANMWFNRIKGIAQVIGFICIGLLAAYGGVVAATGGPPAWASGLANPAAPGTITPEYISYQGTLRDADDNPANGTYDMVVKIYDVGGETALWSETHNDVEVREGHFNLLLGESSSISPDLFTSPDRFIALTVDGTAMTPRQRFASVPYAIAASYATRLSAPDGDPDKAVTVNDDGNVGIGIGTTDPQSRLVVKGGDSNGTTATLEIRAGSETMLLDGNEIDVVGQNLCLNQNSTGDVFVGTDLRVNGNASVDGAENDGSNAALKVSSLGQTILLDGNEIDALNDKLYLNHNSNYTVEVGNDLSVGNDLDWDGDLKGFTSICRSAEIDNPDDPDDDEKKITLTNKDNSVCFLTTVKIPGSYEDHDRGECSIEVTTEDDITYWTLYARQYGLKYKVFCRACCLSW